MKTFLKKITLFAFSILFAFGGTLATVDFAEAAGAEPIIGATTPVEGDTIYKSDGDLTLSVEATDATAVTWELTSSTLTINSGTYGELNHSGNTWSHTYDLSPLPVGSYTLTFTATNVDNDTDTKSVSGEVKAERPVAATPEITNLDAYFVKTLYKGIAVDISVDNLTDATGIEVRTKRDNGDDVVKTNLKAVSDLASPSLNSGDPATTTAPIVIQTIPGGYDEAGSSSWNKPSATWTDTTIPETITVTITRSGGADDLVETIDLADFGTSKATLEDVMPVPELAVTNEQTGETFATLQEAINDTDTVDGNSLKINENLTVTSRVNVTKGLNIRGLNHTISAAFDNTPNDNSNNAIIGILANNVTLRSMTLNGVDGVNIHGVNIYRSTGILLRNITVKDNDKSGVLINGSTVTVENINTSGNTWHGMNVDQGSGVTEPAVLTVKGVSTHSEGFADIYVDNDTKDVTINDVNNQYDIQSGVGLPNDKVYKLKASGNNAPILDSVSPAASALELVPGENFILTINASDVDGDLAELEIDHSMEGTLPEFSVYANEATPCGDTQSCADFAAAGVVVTYSDGTWTIDFGNTITDAFIVNGGITFYLVARDAVGNEFGSMSPTTAANTFAYTLTRGTTSNPTDTTAPTVPVITSPTAEQIFTTTPILNDWTDSTDDTDVDHYQIEYIYDDGHTFSGAPYRETTASQRNHTPGLNEQGGVTIRVRAFDAAGNASDWSNSVHYVYDVTGGPTPDTTDPSIVLSAPTDGQVLGASTLNITGTITDPNFNYYYCYLTTNQAITYNGNPYTPGQEVGVRDANCVTTWSSVETDGPIGGIDMTGLPNGSYTINVVAYDTEGNNNAANPVAVSFNYDTTPVDDGDDTDSETTNPPAGNTSSSSTGQRVMGTRSFSAPSTIGRVLGAESYNFTLLLKRGSRGPEVTELQKFLNLGGFASGLEDGIFGPITEYATKAFQRANGLAADGIVGPLTRAVLNA